MKICCLSDTHGFLPDVPDCDLLLLAGDYCRDHDDAFWYHKDFSLWLRELSDRMKVIGVAGNHDFLFEKNRAAAERMPWTYLQDSGTEFRGLKIWGSPWQPRFYDWAFNLDEDELRKKWDLIPDDTGVLVLHGPPRGYGDWGRLSPERLGSPSLTERILGVKPKLVVAGHIHEGHGVYDIGGHTVFVNAAYVDESYQPKNQPVVVEL